MKNILVQGYTEGDITECQFRTYHHLDNGKGQIQTYLDQLENSPSSHLSRNLRENVFKKSFVYVYGLTVILSSESKLRSLTAASQQSRKI